MRELKFRAWDEINDVMWKDVLGDMAESDMYDDVTEMWEVAHQMETGNSAQFVFMQYTGNEDINGVEIYEGDILKCTSRIYTNLGATRTGEYEETIKQVIWKDDSWGTRVISSNLTSKGAEKSGLVISAKYAEVIGNVWENKDLLED